MSILKCLQIFFIVWSGFHQTQTKLTKNQRTVFVCRIFKENFDFFSELFVDTFHTSLKFE